MNQIIEYLSNKQEKISEMLKLTQGIAEALNEEDTEKIAKLLEQREEVRSQVDIIDEKLGSFFAGDFSELLESILKDDGTKGIYDLIVADLQKMQLLEKQNLQKAEKFKHKIAQDISSLNKTGNAMKGYGFIGKSYSDGAFIDTKK